MSIHHLSNAGMLDMPSTKKLVFMAICDEAATETGLGIPGLAKIQAWAGVGKSRVLELIAELIEEGYLARESAGHKGARAVFRVFAKVACCALHEPLGSAVQDPLKGSAVQDPKPPKGPAQSGPYDAKGSAKGSASYRTPPLSDLKDLKEVGPKAKKKPETPLPDDWQPLSRHGEFATEHGLTLAIEAQRFRNNALAKDVRFVLWDRAFDNWLLKASEWKGGNVTPIRPKPSRRDTPPAPDRESLPW